jgi:hypothetical protein
VWTTFRSPLALYGICRRRSLCLGVDVSVQLHMAGRFVMMSLPHSRHPQCIYDILSRKLIQPRIKGGYACLGAAIHEGTRGLYS